MTASSGTGSGGDLFIAKRGRLARSPGRKKAASDPRPTGAVSKHGAVDAEQLREHREKLIRVTIANRTHETVFQPIVDLKSGGAVGAEALARFSELPIRPPNVWFAEAASVGLGVELEMAALRLALEQLRHVPAGLYLSLNASVETIMSEDFAASFSDIPAERVVLELTEHTEVLDYVQFEQTIANLRSAGVRLAVDDAGAGYSSFRHILNLHPDVIKLDIGLTRGIDGDPARRALGSALLTFGLDAYNASIVAEGIETEGEFATLRALGCPFGQGYFLGRPGKLRVERPSNSPSETLWRADQNATGRSVAIPEAITPAVDMSGAQSDVPKGSQITPSPVPFGQGIELAPRTLPSQMKPRRDDHAELLALVAEIQDRQNDGGDMAPRRRSPLRALRARS